MAIMGGRLSSRMMAIASGPLAQTGWPSLRLRGAPSSSLRGYKSGALFCFPNKRRNRLKVLWFDRNGYCLLYKRLNQARFLMPDERTIDGVALAKLLRGIANPPRGRRRS